MTNTEKNRQSNAKPTTQTSNQQAQAEEATALTTGPAPSLSHESERSAAEEMDAGPAAATTSTFKKHAPSQQPEEPEFYGITDWGQTPTSGEPKQSALVQPLFIETHKPTVITGFRSAAGRIGSGVLIAAGVSTVALLAGGGIAAIILPAVAGKIALDTIAEWLVETGGETLKGWVIDWAKDTVFKPESKQADTERLARDLDRAMRRNDKLANAVANLLQKLDAINEVVDELRDKITERTRVIRRLRDDLEHTLGENRRLRAWTEQLERELMTAQAKAAAAHSPTSLAPGGIPAVDQQPPTGPPSDEEFLRRSLNIE